MFKQHLKDIDLTKIGNELLEKTEGKFHTTFVSEIQLYHGQLLERVFALKKRKNKFKSQEVLRRFEDGRTFERNLYYTYFCGYVVAWNNKNYYYEYEPEEKFYLCDLYEPNICPINDFTLEDVIKLRPDLKYCAWNGKGSFILFLRELHKCPYVEMLSKLGLQRFIGKKSIEKRLMNDKSFRKFLFVNAKTIQENELDCNQILNMYNKNYSLEKAIIQKKYCVWSKEVGFKSLLMENPFLDPKKLVIYLHKQNVNYDVYYDFIKAVKYLKLDINQEKNVYPHEFMKWHDLYTEQYQATINKEIDEKIGKVANKYQPILKSIDDIVMKFPKNTNDFIDEGKELNHCVGRMSYNKKMANEESLIIFIRKKENINKPFLTLEYDPNHKKIVQFYGYHDSLPEKKYQDIIYKKWLPKIKKEVI